MICLFPHAYSRDLVVFHAMEKVSFTEAAVATGCLPYLSISEIQLSRHIDRACRHSHIVR